MRLEQNPVRADTAVPVAEATDGGRRERKRERRFTQNQIVVSDPVSLHERGHAWVLHS